MFVYPGSFNPLHIGHLAIAQYVEARYQQDVLFEICSCPNDKDKISDSDIAKRVKQFSIIGRPVTVTENTSFIEKSEWEATLKYKEIFQLDRFKAEDVTFIVGADTITRIDDIKYYYGSVREHIRAMNLLYIRGVKFLVFPRTGHLTDDLSPDIMKLCEFVTDFEAVDVSSTQLREQATKNYACL